MSEETGSNIRQAIPSEAELLTELALRSKGHWGYDAEFLRDCRIDLTLAPEYIASVPVFVIEDRGWIAGFYSLDGQGAEVELMHLFVEPRAIGRGFGRLLFQHAVETARRLGFERLVIGSDPFALEFYESMGAQRVGSVASIVRPGRMLPLLHYPLSSSLHHAPSKETPPPAPQ
ncbi:MAG TPA: GNAT family N-acetyltransferase [Pyrinomonadaceae bacterium]|jgi:GNAT superfamily N-acetyltransferase|nr:GNAT family N-acetyltransferase [Pyrinomonadaceae bacterium]